MSKTEPSQENNSLIDLAALYATLILIIGTTISEWPPDGQKGWFPEGFDDVLFVIFGIATILIFMRILLLIRNADPLVQRILERISW